MDLPLRNALVLITIQEGRVNGVELQNGHNLHLLMVLSIGRIVDALLPPEVVSFKSDCTVQHYKWKSIIESYMFTFR
jgi:hypothetical protein